MNALKLPRARALLLACCLLLLTGTAHGRGGNAPCGCIENPAFQRVYFHHLEIVETYSVERLTGTDEYTVEPEAFLASLDFIATLAHTSMGNVLNYEVGYPNLQQFQHEKRKWLRWYRVHKCRNLQLGQ